ncbi:type II secretion system protein GspE [candidate division KSB3 bacterium]|uniref:Type II secretion system protein GspE n=1 Tax=candidate division KSB3 bacterium TaxID=2044937 RepID=A0A2G6EBH5_9BACT|nr:MAG: type II secretion system protein GspE [candidate division KSB3 bacterium]PIE30707.1 MAG: type II secretion system protein GspE [candidate division KSB3 bacterium]
MAKKIGEILLKANVITNEQLHQALQEQKRSGERLGSLLVKLGFLEEEEILSCLSKQFGVPAIDLETFQIEGSVLETIPVKTAQKYTVIPISRVGGTLTLAMADPSDIFAIEDIKFMTNYNIEPVVASERAIAEAIETQYSQKSRRRTAAFTVAQQQAKKQAEMGSLNYKDFSFKEEEIDESNIDESFDAPTVDIDDFEAMVQGAVDQVEVVDYDDDEEENPFEAEGAPVIKLVNGILLNAVKRKVSDIHIEPYEKAYRVRYRLDGDLHQVMGLPMSLKAAITSRIKIMSQLDIAEKRLPQDGRIKMKIGKRRDMDYRVSVLPTLFGEKIVLRLLDKSNLQLDMTKLGFEQVSLDRFRKAIKSPFGMVLVTGPTGSGKTTTLYSALSSLNTPDINIMTAEDPVEFNLMGINQVQMHDDIGLNFAAALRSFLRQDPDVILVGEIRDFETAEIGIKAALTGHLVLSTLHTNDAPSTVSRMINMGVEPFLVASSVLLIVAQRLLRRLCDCKEVKKVPDEVPREVLIRAGYSEEDASEITQIWGPKGCPKCGNSGYKGRVALYEVMEMNGGLREMILQGASTDELRKKAQDDGMLTLRQSGLQKARDGMTSLEEVLKVTLIQ